MKDIILRLSAWMAILGLCFWFPGTPLALAQVEVNWKDPGLDAAARAEFATLEPGLASECTRLLDNCQAAEDPAAPAEVKAEAAVVEQAVEAVVKATDTVTELPVPDVGTISTRLTGAGVDPNIAGRLAADAQRALTDIKSAFAAGDPGRAQALADRFRGDIQARYGVDPGVFGAGPETGGITFERVIGSHGDVIQGCMETYIQREIQLGGGVPSADIFREMAVTGVSMEAVLRGGPGEFGAPPPEVLAAMSDSERQMYGAWKAGDFDKLHEFAVHDAYRTGLEHGMTPEHIAREIALMEHAMTEKYAVDTVPRYEHTGTGETTFTTHFSGEGGTAGSTAGSTGTGSSGCAAGTTMVGGVCVPTG